MSRKRWSTVVDPDERRGSVISRGRRHVSRHRLHERKHQSQSGTPVFGIGTDRSDGDSRITNKRRRSTDASGPQIEIFDGHSVARGNLNVYAFHTKTCTTTTGVSSKRRIETEIYPRGGKRGYRVIYFTLTDAFLTCTQRNTRNARKTSKR